MHDNKEIKNILITGGCGFIGTNLILKLLELKRFNIFIIDSLIYQVHGNHFDFNLFNNKVFFKKIDIRDKEEIKHLVRTNDLIIHLASETGTNQSENEIYRYTDTNICGTAILMDILNNEKHNCKKFILASSRAVYGDGSNQKETDVLAPASIYGITKRVQEDLVINSCPIPYTILRLQNVFGEFQSLINNYTGIISIFSKKFMKNEDIEIFDNNEATRDFIHVSNIVDAIILMINDQNISTNNIYNVGSGEEHKIGTVAKILKDILESESKIKITSHHRNGDVLNCSANIDKIKKDFNWFPEVSFRYGLEKFVSWAK